LSKPEIDHIREHKFKSGGYTYLEEVLVNPYWNFMASLIPKWLSPNYVTVAAATSLLSGVVVAWWFDPTMSSKLPGWVHVFMAVSLFAAQTLDGIDGKHARNTGRSSPVGQLLDHGADAFTNCYSCCMVSASLGNGDNFVSLITLVYAQALFWVFNYEEHFTGSLRISVDGIGGTEVQFMAMFVILCPAIDFTGIHRIIIPVLGITPLNAILYLTVIFGFYNMLYKMFRNTIEGLNADKRTHALSMVAAPMLIFISELMLYRSEIFAYHTIQLCCLGGAVFGFYMSKLIICTMAKKEMDVFDVDAIGFFLVQIVSFFILKDYHQQVVVYLIFGAIVTARYLRYVIAVVSQLLTTLNLKF